MQNLPSSWKVEQLDKVVTIEMGQSPPSSSYNDNGKGLPFFQGKAEFGDWYPTIRKYTTSPMKIVEKDTVLLSVRAPVGPTNLAPEKCCIGRGLAGIYSERIPNKYLLYFFRCIEDELSQQGTGTTFSAINKSLIQELKIPLAPLPEQKRIVAKLDKLFAHHDQLKARLANVPELLKQFRQAVLTQAVTGKLTEEWRMNKHFHASDLLININNKRRELLEQKDGRGIDYSEWETFDIPENWKWVRLWEISYLVTSGSRDWSKYYSDKGAYFVRSAEINNNRLRLNEAIFVSLPSKVEGKRSLIEKGDLLVTITGANVGKCAKITEVIPEAYVSQSVALIKLVDNETTDYVHLTMLAPKAGGDQLTKMAYGLGRPVLSLPQIKSIYVPLPPIEEQNEIVRRVDSLFALADKIEARYNTLKEKIDQFPQAILAKAFKGELVEQDELAKVKKYKDELNNLAIAAEP